MESKIWPTDKQSDAAVLAVETEDEIFKFVKGLRGKRLNPVTAAQIEAHIYQFNMFKDADIDDAISSLIADHKIRIVALSLSSHRRHNGAYGYVKW